ncbi:PP2C family protein-serine/threonine phosphatase [Cellulosilyticum ruminicola]|uniref:PP2C family protein-serine/threonine phosphatase n=1 Tax=Cellulosilyticum ruminicola TaxID=425254 RepID=UPI0006D097AE|nr:PP2C family serine/threonine-protein phosphatase [Cellulosilyticum ruminicola]
MNINFKLWFRKLGAWFQQRFKGTDNKPQDIRIRLEKYMYLEVAHIQGQGSRDYQQDTFGFLPASHKKKKAYKGYRVILADGMGGMAHGDEISKLVVQEILKEKIDVKTDIDVQLRKLVNKINDTVYNTFKGEGGSTLILTYIYKNKLHWISVGDSHLYIKRQNELYLINEEHNYLTHLYKHVLKGHLTKQEADSNKSRHGLTQFIGNEQLTEMDSSLKGFELENGDIILICSDGVSDTLSQRQINELLTLDVHASAEAISSQIIAEQNKYQDNFTALIMKWSWEDGI